MFCGWCGKEVEEEWAICPQCGTPLKEKVGLETESLVSNIEVKSKVAKNKSLKGWVVFGALVALFVGINFIINKINASEQLEIIDKLQNFTTVYKEDGEYSKYYFLEQDEEWVLAYSSENEFVTFENYTVIDCFTDAFGEGCFSEGSASDGGFCYDLSDNEARIYLDVESEEGHLTIVNYDLSSREYELMIDAEKWIPTDEFVDFIESYGLGYSIEMTVREFKETLQQNDLAIADLLIVEFGTLDDWFVPEEEITESSHSLFIPTSTKSLAWKEAYLTYLNENGNTEYGYSLDYIDDDDIPELVIDSKYAAEGISVCSYDEEKVNVTPVGEFVTYRQRENLFCASGGRMDYYYDMVYTLVDGVPVEVSRGEYGVLDNENIKYDEAGYMIYQYLWNGESISEYDYRNNTELFDRTVSSNVWTVGNEYLYDIIDILEYPLDITMIHPYLNDNGYENFSNHYVILFEGIEDDKIHFTVTYDDKLVASASATITDSKTAEYKNAKSELVIKFDADYQYFEMEGYIDTIDLTGRYMGRWG